MTTPHPPRPAAPAVGDPAPLAPPVAAVVEGSGVEVSGVEVSVVGVSVVGVSVADLIAAAVLACPSVAGLHGGRFGEAATYLPRRRVTGVRVGPDEVVVHVVGRYPAPVTDIDAEVRAAVRPHLAGLPLAITVEDYAAEDATAAGSTFPEDATTDASAPTAITITVTATEQSTTVAATELSTAPVHSGPGPVAAEPPAAPSPPARPARVTADVTKEIL